MTDKTGLRPRLTHRGGVESIVIDRSQVAGPKEFISFPLFPCRFSSLLSLKIQMNCLLSRPFVVGSLLYLPSSLTSLHIHHEAALTAWLQPVTWTGNNDDNDWGKPYKPIYLDRLFPKLRRLVLFGNLQNNFNPNPRNPLQIAGLPYLEPVINSIMPEDRKKVVDSRFDLKQQLDWTPKMRESWYRHLPHSLVDLELSTSLPEPEDQENCNPFEILPPHLTRLIIPNAHAQTRKYQERLSMIPPSLRDSLVELSITCPQDSPIFDAPLPPHLTAFRIPNSWSSLALGMTEALPPDLRILTMNSMCTLETISYLPPHLTQLELGSCPIYQLIPNMPQRLTQLQLSIRYSSDWPTVLPCLPPSLTSLTLVGEGSFSEESIAAIPREVLHLVLEGSSQQPIAPTALLRLPPNLLSLRLGQCSSNLGETAVHVLPQSLTTLEMNASQIHSDCIPLLPPRLTKLELPSVGLWTDDQIHKLPKTLTRLRLASLKVTGRLLKEGITELTTTELKDSVIGVLPSAIAADKLAYSQVRYSDPVYFSYDQLLAIPQSVTKVDFSGANGVTLPFMTCLPNLTYLNLPCMNTPLSQLKDKLPSLTYLSAPKVTTLGLITVSSGEALFPRGLVHLDLSAYSAPNSFALVFPTGLTYLSIGHIDTEGRKLLSTLTKLETFRMESGTGLSTIDLPKLLPRSLKHLYLGGYAQCDDNFLKKLPPNLESLETPHFSVLSDSGFHLLPPTLILFRVGTFAYKNVDDYRDGPEMTEFDSPKNLIDILCYKRSDIRFRTLSEPLTTEARESISSHTGLKMIMTANSYDVCLGDALAGIISRSVTRLTLSSLHRHLSVKFLEQLPPTLLHLDLGKQEHGFSEVSALALPKGLISLVMNASDFTDPEFLGYLPRSITDLELLRLPGRLTVPKAKLLPPALTRLRLGLCIVGDEVISLLPRSITILDLPNTPFFTNKAIPDLPPNLIKLWVPTSRLTPDCVDLLPTTITSISLGSSSGTLSPFVLSKLKQRGAEKAERAAALGKSIESTVVTVGS
jgi:hypothetical protein